VEGVRAPTPLAKHLADCDVGAARHLFAHDLFQKPGPTVGSSPGQLFRDHALKILSVLNEARAFCYPVVEQHGN
jgi:hypothetical protein